MTTCAANVRSKEVKCDIRKDSMQLSVRGDTIAAGEFYGPVDSSESIWELGEILEPFQLLACILPVCSCLLVTHLALSGQRSV